MQPPIKGSVQYLVERGLAEFGQRAMLCSQEHIDADKKALWYRLKNAFQPPPPKSTWTDRDGNVEPGKPAPGLAAVAQVLTGDAGALQPKEIHWFGCCTSCLDAAHGDITKVPPTVQIELQDGKKLPLQTPDFR